MNEMYYIKEDNNEYILENTYYPVEEIKEIYKLNLDNYGYHQIIKNINNELITNINNVYYILLKKNKFNLDINKLIFNTVYIDEKNSMLDRSNWPVLWENKIDYFEYQLTHLEGKYPLISETIDYFIGMGENAIIYIKNTIKINNKDKRDILTISHRRIEKSNYLNPLNVILDHKSRDISEYLKYIFIRNEYKNINLENLLLKINLSNYGYRLLYGRLYFPSYYFDLYEKIINENKSEELLKPIIYKIKKYEDYLDYIYKIINKKEKIEYIDWK